MRIGIIGATGKLGTLVSEEALNRGHDVSAIVRNPSKIVDTRVHVIKSDILEITVDMIIDFDVIVNAYGSPIGEEELFVTTINHLIPVFQKAPEVRYFGVGGAGSLYTDESKTTQMVSIIDTLDFLPQFVKDTATNAAAAFNILKNASGLTWTYMSPPQDFDAEGIRTGKYILGTDFPVENDEGKNYISYADYAIALVDEIENKNFINQRFTVGS